MDYPARNRVSRAIIHTFLLYSIIQLPTVAHGQVQLGLPAFSAFDAHGIDTVNLQNLNVAINLPVRSKAGAIPFRAALWANSSETIPSNAGWYPSMMGGFNLTVDGTLGLGTYMSYTTPTAYSACPGYPGDIKYSGWILITADTTQHPLPINDAVDGDGCLPGFTDQVSDGTGYTVVMTGAWPNPLTAVYDRSGAKITGTTLTDSNGNSITKSGANFTDTLGTTALTITGTGWSWTDVNGGSPEVTESYGTSQTVKTVFNCSGVPDANFSNVSLPNMIGYPDGTSLGLKYEATTGYPSDTTGRVSQITLREGGTVSFSYGTMSCSYSIPASLTRTTSDGTTTYSWSAITGGNTTTVKDNGGNQTVYQFQGGFLTQVTYYQGSSTLLATDLYCYNGNTTNCATTTPSLRITERDVYHTISGMSNSSRIQTKFDVYGNVTYSAQYDFGGSSPTRATTITYGSCTAGCNTSTPTISPSIGSNINDRPGEVVTTQGGSTVGQSNYTYDSHGNLLSAQLWTGSAFIGQTSNNVYNANGTPSKTFDVANNETDYTYSGASYLQCSGCTQYPFPTQIKNAGTGNYVNTVWYGVGGVKSTDTDKNNATATYGYTSLGGTADPYWRVMSVADAYGNTVYETYPSGSAPTTFRGSFTFNSGNSINSLSGVTDGYGRPINSQKAQSPSGSDYDTRSSSYGWNGNYRRVNTSQPCSTTEGSSCTGVHFYSYDPLERLYTESTTSNETLTHTYSQNTDLAALTPAPSGEHSKQTLTVYDGLGRVTSVCRVGNGSSALCPGSTTLYGVADTYTYTQGSGYTEVYITRGSQTRYFYYDALGRLFKRTTPEGGTWQYDFDTSGCTGAVPVNGLLVCIRDSGGAQTTYQYDSLNRPINITNPSYCKKFRYDNTSGAAGSIPSGVSLSNQYGRLVEAETDDCHPTITHADQWTDEWFAYDKDGRVLNQWQWSLDSTQYYQSTASFYENGAVKTVQLASPSLYTMTWGLDGEGRPATLADSTNGVNIVTGATFYPAANPAVINLEGSDLDFYTFDANTGRMNKYVFTVGGNSLTATLTWNQNGTLASLFTQDGFNAAGWSTCSDAYDDWARLVTFDCGSGNWGQAFSYDTYDNLTKGVLSGRTGTSWNPGYSSTTNRCNTCTYNGYGDVASDGIATYGYDGYEKLLWTATSGIPTCGSSGRCIQYDAFGRMIEYSNGSTWTEVWYTQAGIANMSGTTINWATFPAPGGGTALNQGNVSAHYYLHKDWLGNSRVMSGVVAHSILSDTAFTPYGELFSSFGTGTTWNQFAGTTEEFNAGVMWDTPNRKLSIVGRWLSPDPAGAGWNQYAYATNPNSFVDPLGLGNCPPGQTYSNGHCYTNTPGVGCTDPNNPNPNCRNSPTNPGIPDDPFALLLTPIFDEEGLYGYLVGNFLPFSPGDFGQFGGGTPCSGGTINIGHGSTLQFDAQGQVSLTTPLTLSQPLNMVSGSLIVTAPPNTNLTFSLESGGAMQVSANHTIGFEANLGFGAYISSATYDILSAHANNAGFTQVNGTIFWAGIPLGRWSTPSDYLLGAFNDPSGAGNVDNVAALLQTALQLAHFVNHLSRFGAGCQTPG